VCIQYILVVLLHAREIRGGHIGSYQVGADRTDAIYDHTGMRVVHWVQCVQAMVWASHNWHLVMNANIVYPWILEELRLYRVMCACAAVTLFTFGLHMIGLCRRRAGA
jgi:hypothetical protein